MEYLQKHGRLEPHANSDIHHVATQINNQLDNIGIVYDAGDGCYYVVTVVGQSSDADMMLEGEITDLDTVMHDATTDMAKECSEYSFIDIPGNDKQRYLYSH